MALASSLALQKSFSWDSMASGDDLLDGIKLPCPMDDYQRMSDM
jgi:hypothetical protein